MGENIKMTESKSGQDSKKLLEIKKPKESSSNLPKPSAAKKAITKTTLSQTTSQKFSLNKEKRLLPPVHKSRASTSAIAHRSEKRFDNIKSIMNECKSAKKDTKYSDKSRNPLITFYENKIVSFYSLNLISGTTIPFTNQEIQIKL